LWETIYADEIKLIAVDHPADAEIYVDEKFVAPPYPELRVYKVKNHQIPKTATDGKGNDLLSLIREKDDQYISNFQREKYQGITEMKDLILDLGDGRHQKSAPVPQRLDIPDRRQHQRGHIAVRRYEHQASFAGSDQCKKGSGRK
jgi:hypothetical protein